MRQHVSPELLILLPANSQAKISEEGAFSLHGFRWARCRVKVEGARYALAFDTDAGKPYYESHWGVFTDIEDAKSASKLLASVRRWRRKGGSMDVTCPPLFGETPLGLVLLNHPLLGAVPSATLRPLLGTPEEVLAWRAPAELDAWGACCQHRRIPLLEWLRPAWERAGKPDKEDNLWWMWAGSEKGWTKALQREGLLPANFQEHNSDHDQLLQEVVADTWQRWLPTLQASPPTGFTRTCTAGRDALQLSSLALMCAQITRHADVHQKLREREFVQSWLSQDGPAITSWPSSMGDSASSFATRIGREDIALCLDWKPVKEQPARPSHRI
jgi:hypothetical protein